MNDEKLYDAEDDIEEDGRWYLTPWGCLSKVLEDYGIDISHITGRMGVHLVEDFMDEMVNAGHVKKAEEEV